MSFVYKFGTLFNGNISNITFVNINEIFNIIINTTIKLIATYVLIKILIKLSNIAINKFISKQVELKVALKSNPQKSKTIGEFLKSALKYLIYILVIVIMFYDVFSKIPVAIASAGGFAIGLGAQSLVKDLINGFFIIFENQFNVGDIVTINNYTGTVETITIRSTTLKNFNGEVNIIPNGIISDITNKSKNDMRFIVDADIPYEENIDNIIQLVDTICKDFEEKNKTYITNSIEVIGPISLNTYSVTIRCVGYAVNSKQWQMERELRKRIKEGLQGNNIKVPYPKTEILK